MLTFTFPYTTPALYHRYAPTSTCTGRIGLTLPVRLDSNKQLENGRKVSDLQKLIYGRKDEKKNTYTIFWHGFDVLKFENACDGEGGFSTGIMQRLGLCLHMIVSSCNQSFASYDDVVILFVEWKGTYTYVELKNKSCVCVNKGKLKGKEVGVCVFLLARLPNPDLQRSRRLTQEQPR